MGTSLSASASESRAEVEGWVELELGENSWGGPRFLHHPPISHEKIQWQRVVEP